MLLPSSGQIRHIETRILGTRPALPFGIAKIDSRLPCGGLERGALHEVTGGGNGEIHGAAAALFAAGIAARTEGQILWCVARQDLFAPALAQAGLTPDRVIHVEAGDEKAVLACFEEGLRHKSLGAIVAEIAQLSKTASRQLQRAAESSGSLGIQVRRWRQEPADFDPPTATLTRWRVTALPETALPDRSIGRARWHVELIHNCSSERSDFVLEACDAQGRLSVPTLVTDGQAHTNIGRRFAAA